MGLLANMATRKVICASLIHLIFYPVSSLRIGTLRPKWLKPQRGTAKLWRTILRTNNQTCSCGVMRRIGAHMLDMLERVSHQAIRRTLGLDPDKKWPTCLSLCLGSQMEKADAG